jgi:hypothetical protein
MIYEACIAPDGTANFEKASSGWPSRNADVSTLVDNDKVDWYLGRHEER